MARLSPHQNNDLAESVRHLAECLQDAEAVLIGAGAGLSTSAGYVYDGERFQRLFPDFVNKYGFRDMYTAGFYPYASLEEQWAYWSRYIYHNRYETIPGEVYQNLLKLMDGKDYFVLTTNVDHLFQRSGFDKERLFYTQGDYGLWQCSKPCHAKTYENEDSIRRMVEEQRDMRVPSALIPYCPICGRPMAMNLRADDTFVEDAGWHNAAARYETYRKRHRHDRVLYLELGVGANTPGIIKYPFWRMTRDNPRAVYACVNQGEAIAPPEIRRQSICIDEDIGKVLKELRENLAGGGAI